MPPILALCLVASSTACTRVERTKQTAVLVAAASDLRKVSQPLAAAFERSTGMPVTFSFASSGQLEQQIRQGASFDVYAPAARSYCQSLERDGLADGEDRLYALGRLVAWSKTLQLKSLEELRKAAFAGSPLRIRAMHPTEWPRNRPCGQRACGRRCNPNSCTEKLWRTPMKWRRPGMRKWPWLLQLW